MKLIDLLGGLMFLVAVLEFLPNPGLALESIPQVLSTNLHLVGNNLSLKQQGKHRATRRKISDF